MFEAEIKFKVHSDSQTLDRLRQLAGRGESVTYRDEYYDTSTHSLAETQRELRIRQIETNGGIEWRLTSKSSPFDNTTKSKREFELALNSGETAREFLRALGYVPDISFEKRCLKFRLQFRGVDVEAVFVEIPDLRDRFLELEVQSSTEASARNALAVLRELGSKLGLQSIDEAPDYYVDLVRKSRSR